MVELMQLLLIIPFVFGCNELSLRNHENSYGVVGQYEDGSGSNKVRVKRSNSWDYIRMEIFYDDTMKIFDDEKQILLKELIEDSRDYFGTTLRVERDNWIQLTPACDGTQYLDAKNNTICENDCLPKCGSVTLPPNTKIFRKCTCKGASSCPTDWGQYEGRMRNTDFVLFVTVNEQSCSPQTMAFASSCSLHPITMRPISGFVNICPDMFKAMKFNDKSRWSSTIKHELIHALVFSSAHFERFRSAQKVIPNTPINIIPGVVEKFERTDWEVAEGVIKHDVYMIVTPKVREEARKYFDCSDLEGAELENQGGTGTIGSHWEKRLFENEAMSGVSTQVYAISRLTLALFEDSGWYQVNYTNAEEMTWGKGLGCDFAKKSCLSWMRMNTQPYPFCTREEDIKCNENHISKVRCNLVRVTSSIPSEFDYNAPGLYFDHYNKSVPKGAGIEVVADYCPYYRVFGESARDPTDTRCKYSGNNNYNNYSLEIFSQSARCFLLSKGIHVTRGLESIHYYVNAGCYETSCKGNRLQVKVQNSKFYPCYYTGQIVYIKKYILNVGTVETKIICPQCEKICGNHCLPENRTNEKIGDYLNLSTNPVMVFLNFIILILFVIH